jgi:hypothetical protein
VCFIGLCYLLISPLGGANMTYCYKEFTRKLPDFDPESGSGNYQVATRNSGRPVFDLKPGVIGAATPSHRSASSSARLRRQRCAPRQHKRVLPRGLKRQVRTLRVAFRPLARHNRRCSQKPPLGQLFSPTAATTTRTSAASLV